MQIDEPFGIGRSQELARLDGSWLAILLVLPSHGGRKRASRDPAEHRRKRREELVGMNPSRHAERVRDVFRSSASGAWG